MARDIQPKKEYAFEKKWSRAIAAHGFTALPNLLLRHYVQLGITPPELRLLVALETFRWDDNRPYPSLDTLAKMLAIEPRQARNIITSLAKKGLIIRTLRVGTTSEYSIEPLIHKLDVLATSFLPTGKKLPPPWADIRAERRHITTDKKDEANKNQNLRHTINHGAEKLGSTLGQRYQEYPYLNDP